MVPLLIVAWLKLRKSTLKFTFDQFILVMEAIKVCRQRYLTNIDPNFCFYNLPLFHCCWVFNMSSYIISRTFDSLWCLFRKSIKYATYEQNFQIVRIILVYFLVQIMFSQAR